MEKKFGSRRLCRNGINGFIKAFDTLNYDLLLAKLHVYRFDRDALKVLHSYLSNIYQRTRINKSFS